MRVVFINPAGSLGGAEQVLLNLLAELRNSGPSLDLTLILLAEGPLEQAALDLHADVRVRVVPMPRAAAVLGDTAISGARLRLGAARFAGRLASAAWACGPFVRRLRRELRSLRPDIIHTNGFKAHLLAARAAPREAALIWHLHDFCSSRPLVSKALRWCSAAPTAGIAVSRAVAEDARQTLPGLRVDVIHNAIDLDRFSPGPGEPSLLDRLSGMPPAPAECLRVGLVSTYAKWKGHPTFLEAAAKASRQRGPDEMRFYVIGGPIYQTSGSQWRRAELEEIARQCGVRQCVGFIDFQREVTPLYRALDVVVHASSQPEPFGLTVVEGMACGRPVIATTSCGAAELFAPGDDVLAFPAQDADTLAHRMIALRDDSALRERLGQWGRAAVERSCSRRHLGPKLMDAYRAALADKRRSAEGPRQARPAA